MCSGASRDADDAGDAPDARDARVMRVLQVNHADVGGGAAVAAMRLHRSLLRVGIASHLLVGDRHRPDETSSAVRGLRRVRAPLRAVLERAGLNELDGIGAYGITRRREFKDADVVHFHALNGAYFSYPAMVRLTKHKPAVLTLHDMWALTGHCSFSFGCERWQTGCGRCPHPDTYPAIRRDATALEWRLKDRTWAASALTVVCPSGWMADVARRSILGRFDVRVIEHGLDTAVFAPRSPAACRAALGIPEGRRVVLFAAASVSDRRKGADLVLDALSRIPPSERMDLTILLMGHRGAVMAPPLAEAGYDVVDLGYVADDRMKAAVYSAADVFVFPTRADNSPLVVLEALACGTPVVSFDVGGVAELVAHGRTGLLAAAQDVAGLAEAVRALVGDAPTRGAMSTAARADVERRFTESAAVDAHRALYRELIAGVGARP